MQAWRLVIGRAALFCLLLAARPLWAHPISLVNIDAWVHRDRLEMKLAVMPEDFLLVYGLSANAESRLAKDDLLKSAEKHKQFLLDGLIIRDTEGNRLVGKVTGVQIPPLPPEGLPVTELMATTLVYQVEYPLAHPPSHLTFQQNFGAGSMPIPAIVTLVLTREGLPAESPLRVPGEESVLTVALDWKETASSTAPDYAAAKAREEEKHKQDMGISSYAATYTFVYIANEEVRVEILIPLLTLETWQPVGRTNRDFLEVSEQVAAREPLEKFFTGQNELKLDGVVVKPKLDRLDFYGVDFKDFAMRAAPQRLSAWTVRVGAILSYSTKGAPGHVDLKWTLFNDEMPAARAVIFAYDKGARFTFYPRNPLYHWDNPGAPPLPPVTAVSIGVKARATVAEALLRNVYRAFDYHSESDIYDALARSVQGDLLTELYLKIRQSLVMQEQGGAVARVQAVNIVHAEPVASSRQPGFTARLTWQVEGTVEHWGHTHLRVNEYSAEFEIEPAEGAWKIKAMNVSRQSQVRSAVMLRKL